MTQMSGGVTQAPNAFGQYEFWDDQDREVLAPGDPLHLDVVPTSQAAHELGTEWLMYSLCDNEDADFAAAVAEAVGVLNEVLGVGHRFVPREDPQCADVATKIRTPISGSADGENEIVRAHPIFRLGDGTSVHWRRFVERVAAMNPQPSTSDVAAIASRWVLRTLDGNAATPPIQDYSWRILVNNVNRDLGYDYPATTDAYAAAGTGFAQEVILHELMHVLGSDHIPARSVGNDGGNGNKYATLMGETPCPDSVGHLGATAWGDTANHPSSTPGVLFLPSVEQGFLAEHYGDWYREPMMEHRLVPWYASYDAALDCTRFVPLSDLDAAITSVPEVGVLYGCPGGLAVDKEGWDTQKFSGWYSALQDFSYNTPFSPMVNYVVEPNLTGGTAVTDYLAFQAGYDPTPSSSPANLRRTMYVPPMVPGMVVNEDAPLLPPCPWPACVREDAYRQVQMLDLKFTWRGALQLGEMTTVPLAILFDPPRACPAGTEHPPGWAPWMPIYGTGSGAEYPCCIAQEF